MEMTIGIIVIILVIAAIVINNQIITKKNQAAQAFGSIEVYLKKRFDLIPNLVAMLNKYLAHEKEILLKITELRSSIDHPETSPNQKIEKSNEFTQLLSGLALNVENYPELKADQQFSKLQYELTDIEEQISAARRAYNAAVTSYNNKIQQFPASIIAGIRKDKTQLLLEIPKTEQKEINIKSLLTN
ncbi:MAG: LemA family protein [Flavobacteriales bacterium]|jgi:LemA protein|nr:LemA family protein [Flavobacteriales bacterium]